MKIYVIHSDNENSKSVVIPNPAMSKELSLSVDSGETITEYSADKIGITKEILLDFENTESQSSFFLKLKELPLE